MKKLLPIVFILVTLLIGFFLGILTSAELRHKRMKSVRIYSSERRFREDAYRIFQPDSVQALKIDPVIKKYAGANSDLQKEYRRKFEDLMQKYFQDVKPLLTQEQLERINAMEKRRRDAIKRFRNDTVNGMRHSRDSTPYSRPGEMVRGDSLHNDSINRSGRRHSDMSY